MNLDETSGAGYNTFRLYLALKAHFNKPNYDFFKHDNGKAIKATPASYIKRNDRYFFEKLAVHSDPQGFLVANFAHNTNFWIGDYHLAEATYIKWRTHIEGLDYYFERDLKTIDVPLNQLFSIVPGRLPRAIELLLNNKISLETLVILVDCCKIMPHWNRVLKDVFVWDFLGLLLKKYQPFVPYDRKEKKETIKKILR